MTFSYGPTSLVLDEHLGRARRGLEERGIGAATLDDFNVTSTLDPDVIRGIASAMRGPWVLVTLDGSIVEDAPNFEWDRYAIAWVVLEPHVKGIAAERAKLDIVARHAHQIVDQQQDDHFSYTRHQRHKAPPSLVSRSRK